MAGAYALLLLIAHVFEDRFARRVDVPGAVRIAEAEAREREPVAS